MVDLNTARIRPLTSSKILCRCEAELTDGVTPGAPHVGLSSVNEIASSPCLLAWPFPVNDSSHAMMALPIIAL
jgi:hypothetical protein